jgi:hypothetical protein
MHGRKSRDPFMGTLGGLISIPLGFLNEGIYIADIYSDAEYSYPNNLIKESYSVSRFDALTVKHSAGGGMVMYLKQKK